MVNFTHKTIWCYFCATNYVYSTQAESIIIFVLYIVALFDDIVIKTGACFYIPMEALFHFTCSVDFPRVEMLV